MKQNLFKSIMILFILVCVGVVGYFIFQTPQTKDTTSIPEQKFTTGSTQAIQSGKPYQMLTQDIPADLIDLPAHQIRVIEFFNYACPHCNALNPYLVAWEKKNAALLTPSNTDAKITTPYAHIVLNKIPVTFNPDWQPYSEAFYIADEAKMLTPELNNLLFSLSSIDGLKTEEQMRSFFSHHGLTKKTYDQIIQSPAFKQRQNNDAQLEKTLKITSIPTLIVIRDQHVYEINAAMPQSLINTLTLLTKKEIPHS